MPDKTTVAEELPPLPEPNSYCTHADSHEYDVFDADQMRAYATAALAQKDGEIAALREALQRTTHIIDRMGDMPDEFISPAVWRELKCERAIELARAALGSQA